MMPVEPSMRSRWAPVRSGLRISGRVSPEGRRVLDGEALELLVRVVRRFTTERERVLRERSLRGRLDRQPGPGPPTSSGMPRDAEWTASSPPASLAGIRVAVAGGVEPEDLLPGLNSRADAYIADLEDALAPSWQATLDGHRNLEEAARRRLEYVADRGQRYRIVSRPAALIVRPRAWHRVEAHVAVDGRSVSASFFDLALAASHLARPSTAETAEPCFDLPRLEQPAEARLWEQILQFTEAELGRPRGSIHVLASVESPAGARSSEAIVGELRHRVLAVRVRPWSYLVNHVREHPDDPASLLPPREFLGPEAEPIASYLRAVAATCRHRAVVLMADLDGPSGPRLDSLAREVGSLRRLGAGAVSTFRPGLVLPVRAALDAEPGAGAAAPGPRPVPSGLTLEELRAGVARALGYLVGWMQGRALVGWGDAIDDASSFELARAQLWQWVRQRVPLASGEPVTADRVQALLAERASALLAGKEIPPGLAGAVARSTELLNELVRADEFVESFTLRAAPEP